MSSSNERPVDYRGDQNLHAMAERHARVLGERGDVETHDESASPPHPRLPSGIGQATTHCDANLRDTVKREPGREGRNNSIYVRLFIYNLLIYKIYMNL